MRITNKNYTPLGILAELLTYSPSTDEGTNRFSEKELSSHTYLLSALRERLGAHAHVGDQRPEHFFLALEIHVERAEPHPRTLSDV